MDVGNEEQTNNFLDRTEARTAEAKQNRNSNALAMILAEDSPILEKFERDMVKCFTPVGIINSHYGTLAWLVGAMEEVKWIVSKSQFASSIR